MKKLKIKIFATSVALALSGLMLVGCSTPRDAKEAAIVATTPKTSPTAQSGATLWAQNCMHCHNIRSPDSYSAAQWDVAMLHMRVRANLTADEHKKILAFLKSAH